MDKNKNLYPSNLINLWITISVSLQTHSGRWKGTNPSKCLSHGEAIVPLSKESHMQGPSDAAKYVAFVLREFVGKAEPYP